MLRDRTTSALSATPVFRAPRLAVVGAGLGLLLSAGCVGDALPSTGEESQSGRAPSNSASDFEQNNGDAPGASGPGPAAPTCGEAAVKPSLPAEFTSSCASCHSAHGSVIGAAPDLFAYRGTREDFVAGVRNGKSGMPAFTEAQISTSVLENIHAYFQAGATTATSCSAPILPSSCSGVTDPVIPLFSTPVTVEPISSRRSDGAWVLNGAGRVRGRHEQEAEFGLFHPRYFENRSYRFTVEDTLPAGGTTVRFTWESAGKTAAAPLTNFRYWYTRTGNVFHANVDMTKLSDTKYEWTVTRNERANREIRVGDLLEFEFGVFLDPSSVEGRTNYYTDTFRYIVGSGKLTPLDEEDAPSLSGGGLTIAALVAEPHLSFEQLGLNIQGASIGRFLEGRRLFHTDFSSGEHTEPGNPALTTHANKAGPLLNQAHCAGCHVRNGRGAPPEPGQSAVSTVIKTYASGRDATPHPDYGRQLQDRAIGNVAAEGAATVTYVEVPGAFPDGTPYSLRRPTYEIQGLGGGAIANTSVRVARPLIGMGLLEAVPEEELLQRADEKDCNGDGISGRPNLAPEPTTGAMRMGRFGWKASKVSVPHQVADALLVDLGVTSTLFPAEDCGVNQVSCKTAASSTASPELANEDLERLSTYMRLLGIPARRDRRTSAVARGEQLFAEVGCGSCHAPSLRTGSHHPLVELRNQVIHPYSDLLLHDMGNDLSDGETTEYRAGSSEWRTPPLWGLGLTATVNGHTQLLHDGRARNITEAILWHGGEAAAAKSRFMALTKDEREALLSFLESL